MKVRKLYFKGPLLSQIQYCMLMFVENTLINKSSLHVFLKVFKTYRGIMTSKNFAGFYTISKDFLY